MDNIFYIVGHFNCPECRKHLVLYQVHPVYTIRALFADLNSNVLSAFRKETINTEEISNTEKVQSNEAEVQFDIPANLSSSPVTEATTTPSQQLAKQTSQNTLCNLPECSLVVSNQSGRVFVPQLQVKVSEDKPVQFSGSFLSLKSKLTSFNNGLNRARKTLDANQSTSRKLEEQLSTLKTALLHSQKKAKTLLHDSLGISNDLVSDCEASLSVEDEKETIQSLTVLLSYNQETFPSNIHGYNITDIFNQVRDHANKARYTPAIQDHVKQLLVASVTTKWFTFEQIQALKDLNK